MANPDSFEALSGHGVRAIYSGHTILVGNRKLMDDNKIPVTDKVDSILEQLEKEGKTPLRGEQSPKYCPKLHHHSCFMKLGLFSTRVL